VPKRKPNEKPAKKRTPAAATPIGDDRETEQRILDAARAVFMRRGTAGARMQEIAAEAGVNQALLHYYFRSKERLALAVFQQLASRLFPVLLMTLGSDASVEEKIDAVIALYLENFSKHPYLPGYVLAELHHHPDRIPHMLSSAAGVDPSAMLGQVFAKLGRQIDERVRAGTMRPISPQQFAANLISLCVFPFAARPMLSMAFSLDDAGFARFIDERKRELPNFFKQAIRP
jgi:TetR/AcrR family transcriptional regulator